MPRNKVENGERVVVGRGRGRGSGRGRGVIAPYPLLPLEEQDPSSRGLLVGVSVLGVGGFGHLLVMAYMSRFVLGVDSCCLLA